MKFTKDDWIIFRDESHYDSATSIYSDTGVHIAEVSGDGNEEAEANARLIVKSLNLLSGLKGMIEWIERTAIPYKGISDGDLPKSFDKWKQLIEGIEREE